MPRARVIAAMSAIAALLCIATVFAQQEDESSVPRASVFIGSSVVNPQGENLGRITDLVIEPAGGRIKYAALSYGSLLGFGGKLFAVPWEALRLAPDEKTFVLNIPAKVLETSPGFDRSNWPQRPDPIMRIAASGAMQGQHTPGTDSTAGARPETSESSPGTVVAGTIAEVDTEAETLTIQAEDGQVVELQAPSAMLLGLQTGDAVEVKRQGTKATEIFRKGQTPQPGMNPPQQAPPAQSGQ